LIYFIAFTILTNAPLYTIQKDYEASIAKEPNAAKDDLMEKGNPNVAQKPGKMKSWK
jgi:hypothetical protein